MSDNLPPDSSDEPTGPRLCEETCPPRLRQHYDTVASLNKHRQTAARVYWLNRFEYHQPLGDQVERYGRIRAAGRAMTELILDLAPDSAERTRALERLQEVIMLTNAAIACNEKPAA